MRTLIALLFALSIAPGQQLNITVSPATVPSGGTTTATLIFQDSVPTDNITGIEWTAALPSGITFGAGTTSVANKTLSCNGNVCLIAGTPAQGTNIVNVTPLVSGAVVSFPVTVAAKPGTVNLSLTNLSAVNNMGSAVTMTTTGASITITGSRFDLNSDGVVDFNDVITSLRQVLGIVACTNADLNADSKCDVTDLVIEIRAVLGLFPAMPSFV